MAPSDWIVGGESDPRDSYRGGSRVWGSCGGGARPRGWERQRSLPPRSDKAEDTRQLKLESAEGGP